MNRCCAYLKQQLDGRWCVPLVGKEAFQVFNGLSLERFNLSVDEAVELHNKINDELRRRGVLKEEDEEEERQFVLTVEGIALQVHKVLKKGISRVANPYQPGVALGNRVLQALDTLYTSTGIVFEGSIQDQILLAMKMRMSEDSIRFYFKELEEAGYLTIDGDKFTPSEHLINRYR